MGSFFHLISVKPHESLRLIMTFLVGVIFGFLIGISFPRLSLTTSLTTDLLSPPDLSSVDLNRPTQSTSTFSETSSDESSLSSAPTHNDASQIWVPSNPRGAELLPPGIVVAESDFYLRRLWGFPSEDLTRRPNYLVAFSVGYDQRYNVDACVKKFSENFTVVLFHYDGKTTEWDEFEWSKRAIHVSVQKQTKWWYAKRFLHPDIVAPYEYIFIWDEDLGLNNFNAEEYIRLAKKHGLEISQPGLDPERGITWEMTKRKGDQEAHKKTLLKGDECPDPDSPPCAAFVEIMAPVFSRNAWRCVWHMIQNDLVHGWGLDFAFRGCVDAPHEKIGVVDSQWIVHLGVPSLGNQGEAQKGKTPWQGVRERCHKEWAMFRERMTEAEQDYFKQMRNHSLESMDKSGGLKAFTAHHRI